MLSFTLIVSLISVAMPIRVYAEEDAVEIGVEVQKAYDVDVVLAVANSTQNVDSYKKDLQLALERRGINASNLNIQSVQVNETNILEGKFELKLFWKGPNVDMDAHVEFWNAREKVDELYYRKKEVHGSTLDIDDEKGGIGEIITLSLDTIPSSIAELKVLINSYVGQDTTTMYLYKTVNGVKSEIIKHSGLVKNKEKFYFGSFKRNGNSWDFHFNNGTVFAGKEVEVISKDFMEVLREPDWRASAKKYIVNLNDETVPDFDNSIALGEITSRMNNDQIHYIGWGEDRDQLGTTDLTQNQAEAFIRKNNGLGTFVNRAGSSYQQQVDKMADYIASQSRNEANNEYLTLGQKYDLIVSPSSELSNTKDENWPNGKWRIEHDPSIYENNSGLVPYSGQYLDEFNPTFSKVGQYDIYYADTLVKTLYVHREPVSRFGIDVNAQNEVTLTNLSYDLDRQSQNNGIEEAIWKWKRTTDVEWTNGQPERFVPNQDYVIQLMVKDYQGTWSTTARTRYQSTQAGSGKPIADFELNKNELVWPVSTIEIENTSYDPRSATITAYEWKVFKDNKNIYTGSTPKLDFKNEGTGTYKISLRAKNQHGVWSETLSRFLKILPNTPPTMTSISDQVMTEGATKEINFEVDDKETGPYSVTVLATSSDQSKISNDDIIVSGSGTNRKVSITSKFGGIGQVIITLSVLDGDLSSQKTFKMTILEKSAPEISSIEDQIINISDPSEEISFEVSDSFFAANLIALTASSSNQELIADASIELGGTDENRTIRFTPVAGASGTAVITIEAVDPGGKRSLQSFTVTVKDLIPPHVTSIVVVDPTVRYKAGDKIVIRLTFDEVVIVNGVPELVLDFGNEPARRAQYTGGSDSSELTFEYTLQAGDDTEEITISAQQGLQLAGGSIQDKSDNDAVTDLPEDFVWDTLIVVTVPPVRPVIEEKSVQSGVGIDIISGAPAEGSVAWLAPIGTTVFSEGSTMTKMNGGATTNILSPLTEGKYYLYVIDANGNISLPSEQAIVVDNTAPNAAVLSLPIANDNVINKQETVKVVVSGTAEADAKVEVTFKDGDSLTIVVTTVANENGVWSIDPSDISSLADGTIEVSVKAIDEAGNESQEISHNIYKDTVSPIKQDDVLANSKAVKGGTTIQLDATAESNEMIFIAPPGATLEDLVANGTTVTSVRGSYSEIIAPSVDGVYHVYLVSAAGNVSEASDATITVDNIAPEIHSLTPDTTDWVSDSVMVTIDATDDNGSGIAVVKYAYGLQMKDYFIQNGIQVNNDLFEVGVNGIYTVYVRDLAGNERTEVIVISNIDKEKPTAPTIQLQPNRDFYNEEYTISIISGQDSLSGVDYTEYRILGEDEQEWTLYEESLLINEVGTYTIESRTYDVVGNVSDITRRTIVINREIVVFPSVSISPDVPFSNGNITVNISKEFDENHQDEAEQSKVYYKLPGMDQYAEYTGSFVIEDEGETMIEIMIIDRSGNEVTLTKIVNIDKTPPTNQDDILLEDAIVQGNTLISIQPSEDSEDTIWLAPAGTVSFTEGDTMTKASGDATKIVTPKLDGEYKIYVVDKAGNISSSSSMTVTVDNIPPVVEGIEDKATYKEYPTISFTEGTATLNGKPFVSGTKVEENGHYTFVITDKAGNSTIIEFTVDYDKESVDKDKEALQLGFVPGDHREWVSGDISLSDLGFYGSEIKWSSSHEDILSADGKVKAPKVNTEVTLTATITKGEFTVEKSFTVLVIADPVKPVIILNGSNNVTVEQGKIYVEAGAQAIDNIDGIITDQIAISGFIDTKTIGVYVLIYTVSDQAGNTAQIERTVTVVKASIPTSTIVQVEGDQKAIDKKIKEALQEAKNQKTDKIVLVVNQDVETDAPSVVTISKEQLKTAHDQKTKIELITNNASIIVPISDLDMKQFTGNSRLELVIEKIDLALTENQELVTAVQSLNEHFAIYDGKVFDFKMRMVEEDSQGNVIRSKDIENFQTTEDIVLSIYLGTNIDDKLYFMTFYFNESSKEWEYIRSSYEKESGHITLLTNHLSIYSVMKTNKAQKQAELINILNKDNITVKEVRSIIEDPDMDFDQDTMTKYHEFTSVHKNAVAQEIITKKPNGGYTYNSLSEQVTKSVISKYEAIVTDTEKPVITLIGPSVVYVTKGRAYVETGVTAIDNQDGDITGRVILIGSVDTTKNGTYILRYIVTDVNGNRSEITRTVIVQNASSDDLVVEPEKQPTLPVVIVDADKKGYVIKENKDSAIVLTKEPQMHIIGQVYNVEATSVGTTGPITVQISYDPSKITNLNQLAVYKYNEAEKRWVVVGGIIDATNHTVTITLDSSAIIALMENVVLFKDLDGHWAKDIVEFLAARQIITGDNDGNFNPNIGITRAEFSTLIVRMLNLPLSETNSQFADVANKWYESYIATAQEFGIVKGVSDTSFMPERIVSRQEMAAMIVRTLRKYKDIVLTEEELQQIVKFADTENIGGWALEDVYTAKKLGLMIGRTGNKFAPQSPTLRGEAASVIYNLLKELDLI